MKISINNDEVKLTISGVGLQGAAFSHADFTAAQLAALAFTHADFTGAELAALAFTHADFTTQQLADLAFVHDDFTAAQLADLAFKHDDFTAAELAALAFTHDDFTAAQLADLAFTHADFTAAQLSALAFTHADFTAAELAALAFTHDDFTAAQLAALKGDKGDAFSHADFTAAQLTALAFTHADFTGEQLSALAFTHADFTAAELTALAFTHDDFTATQLAALAFTHADFTATELAALAFTHADFTAAQLTDLAFTHADFTAAQLSALAFTHADFTATELAALAFTYADFTTAQLAALKGDKGDTGDLSAGGAITGDVSISGVLNIPHDEALIKFDSAGHKTITSNDGQGNFAMMAGVDDAGNVVSQTPANTTTASEGTVKVLLNSDDMNGELHLATGVKQIHGDPASFTMGMAIKSDGTLRVGSPNAQGNITGTTIANTTGLNASALSYGTVPSSRLSKTQDYIVVTAADGLQWENGRSRLSHNDGGGNCLMRFGNQYTESAERYTAVSSSACVFRQDIDSINQPLTIKVGSVIDPNIGVADNDVITWGKELKLEADRLSWEGDLQVDGSITTTDKFYGDGSALTGVDAVIKAASNPTTVSSEGTLLFNTTEDILYVSNGTAWLKVTTDADPVSTGGTVAISAIDMYAAASYDVDNEFTFVVGAVFEAYSLESGTLPPGLSLNTTSGVISGFAPEPGNNGTIYNFGIRGTDTDGDFADQAYTWQINRPRSSSTCSQSGLSVGTRSASNTAECGDCVDTSGTVDGCSQGFYTWSQAKGYCEGAGARLCTKTELLEFATSGNGCSHDNRAIWTSTPTNDGSGKYWWAVGAQDNYPENSSGTLLPTSNNPGTVGTGLYNEFGIRCCGDTW